MPHYKLSCFKSKISHSKIEIELFNQKHVILDIKNLYIKYFEKPRDITVTEIKELEDICKDIEFLDYDNNFLQRGYFIYENVDVFSIHYVLGDESVCAVGKIIKINGYEFEHDILTEQGSSGGPIILLNNNINFLPVIGIHKQKNIKKDINRGTFIGEIINEIINELKEKEKLRRELKEDLKEISVFDDNIINEINLPMYKEYRPISIEILNKVMKSVCKIMINKKVGDNYQATGFFLKISDSLKFLITNYHVLNPDLVNFQILIEIWNKNIIQLNINDRYIKYFEEPKDITVIRINDQDDLYKDIEFLNLEPNYKKGYFLYKGQEVFSVHYPLGKVVSTSSGKIIDIRGFEFFHNTRTYSGSSGCTIISYNNINLIGVIDVHKQNKNSFEINKGTFIGEII